MSKYYFEWIIDLNKKHKNGVKFFGQDDKAKIPCGDEVPISTGVRPSNRGVVAEADNRGLVTMDHDFHLANLIPSVTLDCNIPSDLSGSFFIGDEDGNGQIFVTLKDATFDPSNVFDHCAQLVDTIRKMAMNPTVLLLQTDGGPDHSLTRCATKFAVIAMCKELDLDHIVVLRGAPNGSARNKVERAMSVLNIPLSHAAVRRGVMPEWAEKDVKNCSSTKAVRELGEKTKTRREKAERDLPRLQQDYVKLVTREKGKHVLLFMHVAFSSSVY